MSDEMERLKQRLRHQMLTPGEPDLTCEIDRTLADAVTALDRLSGRVTVKALEWDAWDGGMTTAKTPLGKFILAEDGELTTPFSGGCKRFETPKVAKAAAQADFEARVLAAIDTAPAAAGEPVTLTYTNYRGDTAERVIEPKGVWFGKTDWHPEPQWFLRAIDCQKGAMRDFALRDFGVSPDQIRREAARSLLADFEAEKLPEHAIDAADDMHSEGDSGNTSDIIEAFLKALITGGDDDHSNP